MVGHNAFEEKPVNILVCFLFSPTKFSCLDEHLEWRDLIRVFLFPPPDESWEEMRKGIGVYDGEW